MEKTNSNIPTPEELKAYIDESVISVTGTYEQSASVLMVDDSIIGTLGNFSASIGKAKSKKTFNVSAIAAAALTNGTVLHYRACFPEDKRKILYIDTEQGKNHCQKVLDRILRLADLPEDCDADNLMMLALRKYSPEVRLAITEQAIGMIPDLGLVIIDGIRDFVYDINSPGESTDVILKKLLHLYVFLQSNFVLLHQTISLFCMKQLNRIKVVLVEQNRTAKWLSEQIGKNTCSVSRWCTNTSQPDLETLFRIADVLSVDVRELIHVEKKNNSTNFQ